MHAVGGARPGPRAATPASELRSWLTHTGTADVVVGLRLSAMPWLRDGSSPPYTSPSPRVLLERQGLRPRPRPAPHDVCFHQAPRRPSEVKLCDVTDSHTDFRTDAEVTVQAPWGPLRVTRDSPGDGSLPRLTTLTADGLQVLTTFHTDRGQARTTVPAVKDPCCLLPGLGGELGSPLDKRHTQRHLT